ncbi:MAG: helix-turn-helix domain-containing protein [Acidobacteriota bacterium]|jgi:hypothetical protein|nr:helix-turn-helix domain-containing protein [Acidobacteriota bacterium]
MDAIGIFASLKEIEGKPPSEINTQKRDEYIVLLRAQGETLAAIGKRLGVSKVTVINVLKNFPEEVRRLQLAEMEELIHEHRLTLRQRAENYARDISRIDTELAKRDLSKVPTEKLFDLKMKLTHAFVDDIVEKISGLPRKQNFRLEKLGVEI